MSNWKLHTPNGVNDILPDECAVKKEIECNNMVCFFFNRLQRS